MTSVDQMSSASFDVHFYQQCYSDLAALTPEQATNHWVTIGQAEGRLGTYALLLASRQALGRTLPEDFNWQEYISINGDLPRPPAWGRLQAEMHYLDAGIAEKRFYKLSELLRSRRVDLSQLPRGFNWRAYLALNPHLVTTHINSRQLAEIHYLEYGCLQELDYLFDLQFYRDFNGLRHLPLDEEKLLSHYRKTGIRSKLPASLAQYVKRQGFPSALIPPYFDYANFCKFNPSHGTHNPSEALLKLLRCEFVDGSPVSKDSSTNRDFYKNLGLFYEKAAKDQTARTAYAAALAYGPDGQLLENMGNIALRLGQRSAAIDWYRFAATISGHSAFVYINGAKLLSESGAKVDAMKFVLDGLKRLPLDASALEDAFRNAARQHWDHAMQRLQPLLAVGDRLQAVEVASVAAAQQYQLWCSLFDPTGSGPVQVPASPRSVLIVGDHHVPQCIRYRIDQKVEQLQAASYSVTTTDWTMPADALKNLPWHDIVIFYRVPATPEVIELMAAAQAHGKCVFYEIDDLLFDTEYPHSIDTFGGQVDVIQYNGLQQGMATMRAAATLCDYGIASTRPLQELLAPLVRQRKCFLHRNGLDRQNIASSEVRQGEIKNYVNLFYGSGTKSHNSDFLQEVLSAVARLLTENPNLKLTVVGYLELPDEFLRRYRSQILLLGHVKDVQAYWSYLSVSDINIAVLTPDRITDCKSELKWVEAATYAVPSVVSATANYIDIIKPRVDGLIAHSPADWYEQLNYLVHDASARRRIGQAARVRVYKDYSIAQLSANIDSILQGAARLSQRMAKLQRTGRKPTHTGTNA
jgi:glycosyltransferase involved in cell wall biosynthesis